MNLIKILKIIIVFIFILKQENETYQEQLKKSQNEYLQVTKDRDYLLDRLLAYENVSESDSTDCTDESETEIEKTISQNKLNSASTKK